jgi:hypothetical protein
LEEQAASQAWEQVRKTGTAAFGHAQPTPRSAKIPSRLPPRMVMCSSISTYLYMRVGLYRSEPLRPLGIYCGPIQNPISSPPDPYQGPDVSAKERERSQLARRKHVPGGTYPVPNEHAIVAQSRISINYTTSDGRYEIRILTVSRPDILGSRVRTASDARTS